MFSDEIFFGRNIFRLFEDFSSKSEPVFFGASISETTLETRKDRNAGFQYWADCRFSLPRLKPRSREAPAIMNFFGMYSDEGTAAVHGVERWTTSGRRPRTTSV